MERRSGESERERNREREKKRERDTEVDSFKDLIPTNHQSLDSGQ